MRGSTAGIGDGIVSPKISYHGILLELIDTFYATFVVAPLVVGFWRGTWNLSGIYLYPSNLPISLCISLGFGIACHLVFSLVQSKLNQCFNPDKHRLVFYVGSRCYTYIYAIACVNCWRGGWQLIDMYTTHEFVYVVIVTLGCALALCLMKGIRNISASPFVIVNDCSKDYFEISTYFKTSVSTFLPK
jgi:hypothetical protein